MKLHSHFIYTFCSIFAHYRTWETLRLHISLGDKLRLSIYICTLLYFRPFHCFTLCTDKFYFELLVSFANDKLEWLEKMWYLLWNVQLCQHWMSWRERSEGLVRPFVGLSLSSRKVTVSCEPSVHMSVSRCLASSTPRKRTRRHGKLSLFQCDSGTIFGYVCCRNWMNCSHLTRFYEVL
jgi:hypothetical protein